MTLPEAGTPATGAAADLRVALLGTGRMGSAMAERLRASGVTVTLYNRTPERATELAARIGAGTAATPAEAAAGRTSSSRWSPTTTPSPPCTAAPMA